MVQKAATAQEMKLQQTTILTKSRKVTKRPRMTKEMATQEILKFRQATQAPPGPHQGLLLRLLVALPKFCRFGILRLTILV